MTWLKPYLTRNFLLRQTKPGCVKSDIYCYYHDMSQKLLRKHINPSLETFRKGLIYFLVFAFDIPTTVNTKLATSAGDLSILLEAQTFNCSLTTSRLNSNNGTSSGD